MIQLIRRFLDSRIGVIVAIACLGLIALAFAGTDVSSNKLFGGVAGGDRVATVGDEKIGTAELQRSVQTALERYRQQNPTVTMQVFVAEGAVGKVLDEMLDRESVAVFASKIGLRAGRRLVDSEIANAPYFRGASGKFDDDIYKQALRQQGLSEKELRDDLAKGLLVKQAAVPVSFGTVMPTSIARRYAGVLSEARKGAIALIPSAAYAPAKGPDEAQLNAFYKETRTRYIRPERRVLQYATFDESALKDLTNAMQHFTRRRNSAVSLSLFCQRNRRRRPSKPNLPPASRLTRRLGKKDCAPAVQDWFRKAPMPGRPLRRSPPRCSLRRRARSANR